ncbi:MAG: IS1634 family transposase [Candidatus Hydrogenedentes bacterium]|nr:IS1634 family transposase [Candidatus Hydrogenedentota bacterium]
MFLRRHTRKKKDETYEYWTLVESVRTHEGPRQRIVAAIGKLPGLDEEARVGWEHIGEILDGRLHQRDLLRADPDPPAWATVDTSRVRVERLRRFGEVYLGLALWRRLKLDAFFDEAMAPGREEIAWGTMACILVLARFCAPSSELQIADFWYGKTALDDLLGVAPEKVNDDRLYRALDALLPHKDALFAHFQKVYGELFGTTFDILLYDITSTYFEGQAKGNPQAQRGYSRDSRPDCVQVCIALVVTPEGLPLSYEVFDGNRTDVTTVEEIVETMRGKYGHERRTWVMDRGMVSEDNLDMLRDAKASYLVGTPKSMLKQFDRDLLEEDWEQVESNVEVKLRPSPDGSDETFVLCRSRGRIEKEKAIREKQRVRLETELNKLKAHIDADTRTLRNRSTAERRVGRLFEKYSRAARFFQVNIGETDDPSHKSGKRLNIAVTQDPAHREWAELTDGCYLLRTNLKNEDAKSLWRTYIGLTQIEDSFRIGKHDLGLRPIFHHKPERTQAHILVCFLALVMWRTLQQWMEGAGLGTAPRKLLEEMAEVRSMDVVLPTGAHHDIRLRTVSRPESHLAILLQKLGLPLPNKPKSI